LHSAFLQIGRLKCVNRSKGTVNNHAVDHVPQLAAVKGLTFAWFGELKIDDDIWLIIDLYLEIPSQITRIVHVIFPLWSDLPANAYRRTVVRSC
jgi:hypothetical protein